MANSLINGPAMVEAGVQPASAPSDVVPTWGYKGSEAKIFNLKPGEKLPKGWSDTPKADVPAEPEPEPPADGEAV